MKTPMKSFLGSPLLNSNMLQTLFPTSIPLIRTNLALYLLYDFFLSSVFFPLTPFFRKGHFFMAITDDTRQAFIYILWLLILAPPFLHLLVLCLFPFPFHLSRPPNSLPLRRPLVSPPLFPFLFAPLPSSCLPSLSPPFPCPLPTFPVPPSSLSAIRPPPSSFLPSFSPAPPSDPLSFLVSTASSTASSPCSFWFGRPFPPQCSSSLPPAPSPSSLPFWSPILSTLSPPFSVLLLL